MKGYIVTQEVVEIIQKKNKKEFKNIDVDAIDCKLKDDDPIYRLLYFPNEIIQIYNTEYTYINRFLYTIIDICARRIGLQFYQSAIVKRVLTRVHASDVKNHKLKLFTIFALMHLEPVVIDFVRASYKNKVRLNRFNEILPALLMTVQELLHTDFGPYNIVPKLNYFLRDVLVPLFQTGHVYI